MLVSRVLVGAACFLAALFLLPSPGSYDVPLFLSWIQNVTEHGVVEGYRLNATAQPPLYAVLLSGVGHLAAASGVTPFVTYKRSLLLAWVLTALASRCWTRRWMLSLLVSAALLPSSLALGYFDVYLAPFLILALCALRKQRYLAFSIWFSGFCLMKSQALILAPFFACFVAASVLENAGARRRNLVALIAPAGLISVVVAIVFGAELVESFRRATTDVYYSGYALNVPWLVTWLLRAFFPDEIGGLTQGGAVEYYMADDQSHPIWFWSRLCFFAAYGLVLARYAFVCWKGRAPSIAGLLGFSLSGYLVYFLLNTGVHENHLVYAMLLALLLLEEQERWTPEALFLVFAANINMVLFFGVTGTRFPFSRVVSGVDSSVCFALLNLVFVAHFIRAAWGSRGFVLAARPGAA